MLDIRGKILWWAARRLIERDQPFVIAIGGGIAKTSTKVSLGTVLTKAFPGQVRVGFGNLNTYLGVPLAVLDFHLDFHQQKLSVFHWLWVLKLAIWKSLFGKLPKYLVLEYGTDRPGDIASLVKRLAPDMALLTIVAPAHVANYGSLEAVAEDESALVAGSKMGAPIIINAADPFLALHRKNAGLRPVIEVKTKLETIAGEFARAAAAQLGVAKDVINEALATVQNPAGRFQFRQVGGYKLVDDSYNANPASMEAALHVLEKLPAPRVAVLGTMLEQGEDEVAMHKEVGEMAHRAADTVIGVGQLTENYQPTVHYQTSEEAARAIFSHLPETASILVKGSRGVHMEKIVKQIVGNDGNN